MKSQVMPGFFVLNWLTFYLKQCNEILIPMKPKTISKSRLQQLAGIMTEQFDANRRSQDSQVPRIVSYYETYTPEDVEAGEASDRGELDDVAIELDEFDIEEGLTVVDLAVKYLTDSGAYEPSSMPFSVGTWYNTEAREDYRTGDNTTESYHLKGFSPDDEKQIYKLVIGR
jgi:hypothetical protein